MSKEPEQKQHLVCAIYTRKSTTEGLDQEFSTLDAQRESAESYINSQKHEGWTIHPELYDDGGFTGANIDRPALQKLLNDIKAGKINCVVVYKVDRLSRSLLDFSQLLEFFDKNKVAFVSVTQQFNTNTSMGRLTLNILLSFAQFEREIISERTKDKMGAARRRGQWLGGRPPFGYIRDPETKKLTIEPLEAAIVKEIYTLYLRGNSSFEITQILNNKGTSTRPWTTKKGKAFGNKSFSDNHILYILKNPTYIGQVNFGGTIYVGQQPAIIEEADFIKVQRVMEQNRVDRKPSKNAESTGLLTHILKCRVCNTAMIHTYTIKKHKHKYRYYVCGNYQKRVGSACPNRSIPAQLLENAVVEKVKGFIKSAPDGAVLRSAETEAIISTVWDTLFPLEQRRTLKHIVKEVDCDVDKKRIGIIFQGYDEKHEFDAGIEKSKLGRQWRKDIAVEKEPRLRRSLILAHQLKRNLVSGTIKSLQQASECLNMSLAYLNHMMSLLMLCPAIQEEILMGDNATIEAVPEYQVRDGLPMEIEWDKQIKTWMAIRTNASKT